MAFEKNTSVQIPDKKTAQFEFSNTDERNKFLDFFFPERACTDTPGYYKIANGNLGVRLELVTVYR